MQFLGLFEKQNALHLPVFSGLFGNSEQENNLQTIRDLIKYTVLEIQFWSVNCTAVTLGYAQNFEQHFIPSHAMFKQRKPWTMDRLDENKPLQNAFNLFSTAFTHSNFTLY